MAAQKRTYPELVRFLMRDRPGYLGWSNGDYRFWGPEKDHFTERTLFLLGAKADIMGWHDDELMSVVAEIADLREGVGWWQRSPRYMDSAGLCAIPPVVEARRHLGHGRGVADHDRELGPGSRSHPAAPELHDHDSRQ